MAVEGLKKVFETPMTKGRLDIIRDRDDERRRRRKGRKKKEEKRDRRGLIDIKA